jgi:hypothetical protein
VVVYLRYFMKSVILGLSFVTNIPRCKGESIDDTTLLAVFVFYITPVKERFLFLGGFL